MEKFKLEIVGLSYSQTQSGAYALVLQEAEGSRRLPIIIGGFEAQAIAIELEKMVPTRPLTHDLFKNFATAFDIQVKEVVIYNLVEGIFYSKLICEQNGKEVEIDARTSDAIAIGIRFNCEIYTYENILDSAGITMDETGIDDDGDLIAEAFEEGEPEGTLESLSVEELQFELNKAIEDEDYELASKIRDEINKRDS
jgi:bifunctional DNase/RNase